MRSIQTLAAQFVTAFSDLKRGLDDEVANSPTRPFKGEKLAAEIATRITADPKLATFGRQVAVALAAKDPDSFQFANDLAITNRNQAQQILSHWKLLGV